MAWLSMAMLCVGRFILCAQDNRIDSTRVALIESLAIVEDEMNTKTRVVD